MRRSALIAFLAGCTAAPSPLPPEPRPFPAPPSAIASAAPAPSESAIAASGSPPAKSDAIDAAAAETILFTAPHASPSCAGDDDAAKIKCMIALRYAGSDAEKDLAIGLFSRTGDVAGVEREQDFDGGYRGVLHLVPELPVGARKKHLAWMVSSLDDYDDFFTKLGSGSLRYRWRNLAVRFFRSVHARTPSAYADGWTVSYNVDGSLNTTADGVRETLFHEIFHLNDADHKTGADGAAWSHDALGPIFDAQVKRCGTNATCLRPYTPNDTMVKGGTYYAYQPGNGVHEYAAELALRFYREERAILRGEKPKRPAFKCGSDENRRAWDAIRAEFFGGADVVPACSP